MEPNVLDILTIVHKVEITVEGIPHEKILTKKNPRARC